MKRNGTSSPAWSTRLWSPSHTARPTAGDGIGSHKRQWKTMGRPTGAEGCFTGWPRRVSRRVTQLKHPGPLMPAVVEHRSHPFPIPRAGAGAGAAAPATPGPGPAAWRRPEGGSWGTHSSGSRCGTPEGGGGGGGRDGGWSALCAAPRRILRGCPGAARRAGGVQGPRGKAVAPPTA